MIKINLSKKRNKNKKYLQDRIVLDLWNIRASISD